MNVLSYETKIHSEEIYLQVSNGSSIKSAIVVTDCWIRNFLPIE